MSLLSFLKPREISLTDELGAVKEKGKLQAYVRLEPKPDAVAGYAIRWFRGPVNALKWETYLYPLQKPEKEKAQPYALLVSASSKEELIQRVEGIKNIALETFDVVPEASPFEVKERIGEKLSLGMNKEGGLR